MYLVSSLGGGPGSFFTDPRRGGGGVGGASLEAGGVSVEAVDSELEDITSLKPLSGLFVP